MFTISDAFARALVARKQPAITKKSLVALLRKAYVTGEIDGLKLRVKPRNPEPQSINQAINRLETQRVVRADPDFGKNVYRVVESVEQTAETVCSVIDPFCYVSHASALQRYGLSERNPSLLTFTSPDGSSIRTWRNEALAKAKDDLERQEILARFERIAFPAIVREQPVRRIESKRLGESLPIEGGPSRIGTIGQTFLDTLLEPALCGGMTFAITIWERDAERFLFEIMDAVDRCSAPIVKVRAGYLLEAVVGATSPRIDAWLGFAQRGSSRKLDPERPFDPRHSERWMLSLNV